jgi:acetylornithine deacetylase
MLRVIMSEYLYDTAARLLGIDNTSGNASGPAMDLLAKELRDSGFEVVLQPVRIRGVDQHNLVAWAGPAVAGGLILSGHVDTVPCLNQPGWTHEPIGMTVDEDRIFGRGVADMKGFLAQCLAAVRQMDVAALTKPVVLALTAEEEVGCSGAELLAPALGEMLGDVPVPRMCWIGEPTTWAVYQAHKGIVQVRIAVHGAGGHSSLPHQGVNAIAVAGRVVETMGQLQAELREPVESMRELFAQAPYTTCNVGTIHGGTATNMIAEQCDLTFSYRPLPDADPLAPFRELTGRLALVDLADHGGGDGRASIVVEEPEVVPPLHSTPDTPLARALEAVLGESPRGGAPYATDGGRFAETGLNVLICGPGDLAQAHQPDESLSRAAFEKGPRIIGAVLEHLCEGRGRS